MMFSGPEMGLFGGFFLFWFFWVGTIAIINIMFAVGVYRDGSEFETEYGATAIVPTIIWAIATLMGGVFVAAAYWIMHRSALSNNGKPMERLKENNETSIYN